jgi:hypothetical protein
VESVANLYVTSSPFTDNALAAGIPVKAVHFTELRVRIDVLRVGHGLGVFPWTDASLTTAITARAAHLEDLRAALREAYLAAGQPPPTFSDSVITPGTVMIKARHLQELRDAVIALEAY